MQLINILKNINSFENSKDLILKQWTNYSDAKSILNFHDVDITLFTTYYASGVFEYFMDVIRGSKDLGDCPVMHEFLAYLKDKNISANELFTICSYFRRSIIDFVYEFNMESKELLDEISYLFDSNFSGVLNLYVDTIYQKEKEIEKNIELLNEYKKVLDESAIVSKTDANGVFIYANDKFCKISGYSEAELLGQSHMILKDSSTNDEFFEDMWKVLKDEQIYKGTIKNRKKNGKIFYLDVTMLSINESTEFIAIGYEVTQLIETTEQALEDSKAKESFLSSMSHEIRTPLNAILGFITILMEDEKDLKHASYLKIINDSGETLLSIINDILDFSKLKSGSFSIEDKVFNPYDEFSHILDLFSESAYKKNILINFTLDYSLPNSLIADTLRIKQVFSNLFSNAIKFTHDGGEIDIFISYKDEIVKIIVSDNGRGVKNEEILFDAFKQDKDTVGGTGLGLSISKDLATHMDGDIVYKKKNPKGSIFEFTFKAKVGIKTEIVEKNELKNNKQRRFKGHVLVAEDNMANQELIKVILNRYGLSYYIASNGIEAVNTFKIASFDLVLMDKQMPLKDGLAATKDILDYEKDKGLEHIPIVGLSANVVSQNYYWDGFLGKPLIITELENILQKYLQEENSLDKEEVLDTFNMVEFKELKDELLLNDNELGLLLSTFFQKMKKSLPELLDAIEKKDYKKISLESHSIKGSASNFRFTNLESMAKDLEQHSKKVDKEFNYLNTFNEIEKILAKLIK